MTRETKIGLLVGLAFIIIVGILLSEPLNHAGDSQPAPLPSVGQNVRMAVSSPGTVSAAAPPISMQTTQGGATPVQPVPTHEEVARPRGGIQIVVGGGGEGTTTVPNTQLSNDVQTPVNPPVPHHTAPPSTGGDPIFHAAEQVGEQLIPVGTQPENVPAKLTPAKQISSKGTKQYEAAAGDSLSKIATKFYGTNSKAGRDAILAANPSLKGDPNKIMAGVTYAIPAVDASPATPAAPPTPAPAPTPKVAPKNVPTEKENWYTVKSGDNLWAIARDQCGDTAAIPALKELNKDTLKGGDSVRVGMKIKLPTKVN